MSTGLAGLAGAVATVLFVASTLPMLAKALRTKDLASYSGGNLVVANLGNLTQTLYLTTVPSIPIWTLHLFNTLASASMLILWIRHRCRDRRPMSGVPAETTTTWGQPSHADGRSRRMTGTQV